MSACVRVRACRDWHYLIVVLNGWSARAEIYTERELRPSFVLTRPEFLRSVTAAIPTNDAYSYVRNVTIMRPGRIWPP